VEDKFITDPERIAELEAHIYEKEIQLNGLKKLIGNFYYKEVGEHKSVEIRLALAKYDDYVQRRI